MEQLEQRSDEWFAIRCGKVTASCISKVMTRTKSGWGADRANYMAQLVAERLTGVPAQGFTNAAMQWGVDQEANARAAYAFQHGVDVAEQGFAAHPTIAMAGASPDGLIGDGGLVEIKCPNTATHIETLLGSPIEDKYRKQMQFQMACTGRQWCDFVSYDPRLGLDMQLHVQRVDRDDAMIAEIEEAVSDFLDELSGKVAELKRLYQ